MQKTYNQAVDFANRHTQNLRRKLRGYAVSDFLPYRNDIFAAKESRQTYDEAYALYTYWSDLSNRNPAIWSAVTGREFIGNN